MDKAIPKGSAVYIRYKDHVLFKNTFKPIEDVAERETLGWLTQENNELLCIQHDRTVESPHHSSGTASGMVLLKSCILEICQLPLQKIPSGSINCQNNIINNAEYAPQNPKRKTQPK
ncbi:hypothetical protein G4O51_11190 [Candidatus Bathyarchaeota archaeon A05DMB-2]|jgi:hypothetical protein|nr:hypothetical protein [Candidatus Bathyarchaeota archaeon A05DMB-2]